MAAIKAQSLRNCSDCPKVGRGEDRDRIGATLPQLAFVFHWQNLGEKVSAVDISTGGGRTVGAEKPHHFQRISSRCQTPTWNHHIQGSTILINDIEIKVSFNTTL